MIKSLAYVLVISIIINLMYQLTINISFGKENNTINSISNSSLSNNSKTNLLINYLDKNINKQYADFILPSVNITYPPYPPTINNGNITIKGTANDSSGIKVVSANAHTFPFNGSFPI